MTIADQATVARLLRAYGVTPPVTRKGSKRRAGAPAGGISLQIDAADDPYFGRSIQLTIGRRRSSGPCPMNEFEAERLVEEFRLAHLLPDRYHEDMTLAHLLVRCAHLYDEAALTELHLRCHLTPRGYRVENAQIVSESALKVPARLASDAHDRKAVFEYRGGSRVGT